MENERVINLALCLERYGRKFDLFDSNLVNIILEKNRTMSGELGVEQRYVGRTHITFKYKKWNRRTVIMRYLVSVQCEEICTEKFKGYGNIIEINYDDPNRHIFTYQQRLMRDSDGELVWFGDCWNTMEVNDNYTEVKIQDKDIQEHLLLKCLE